jgi:hypothetical protein
MRGQCGTHAHVACARRRVRTPRFASRLFASPSVSSFGSATAQPRRVASARRSRAPATPESPAGAKTPRQRASQARADARYPVVVHQQRGEALQRRKALQLHDFVVAQVHAVKLVLLAFAAGQAASSARCTRASAGTEPRRRACVTARFSTLPSLWPAARSDRSSGEPGLGLSRASAAAGAAGRRRAHATARTRVAAAWLPRRRDAARRTRLASQFHSPSRR